MSAEQLITQHINTWTSALQTRSTAGRGNNGKIDLYGIKKLRELILELAVRGKLVPQDPNDEPASELLKRIAAEKAELMKQEKIKKQKPLAKINKDETPFELPESWEWTSLGFLTNYGQCDKAEPEDAKSNTWIVELEDIEKETSRLLNRVTFSERPFKSSKNRFSCGDVLYGKLRPYLNKVLIADDDGVCTTEIIPVRPFNGITSEYLSILLKSPSFIRYANESTHGMNMPRLGTDKAINALTPLAPVNEQINIVQKVNELMSLCDQLEQQSLTSLDAHSQLVETLLATLTNSKNAEELAENWVRISQHLDTLFTTEASIDALKQTILQLAVMGKLVPQDPNDEPASELLKRIEQEKAQLVKEGKIKKQKLLPPISDDDIPFELPKGWMWSRVGDILSLKNGYAFKSNFFVEFRSKYILTTPGNFYETGGFRHRGDKTKYYDGPLDEEFILNPGDLIIPMTEQAPGLLGSAAFIPKDEYMYLHNQRLGKLEIYYEGVTSEFIFWFFNSQLLRTELARTCTGTTVRHTSPDRILNALVPVVPSNEQYRITEKINNLMLLCDVLKSRLQSAQQTQLHLADALTDAALN
ncbi:restriction endonuclease subunit S [Pantoea sp. GD03673]|uniref:restriction endonuclease subunit S n=1 Tax=Pantoea sp. GD03673 TaxID=2975364 RepID=UPI002446F84D|nr:restriction endonuclease subunit S [Pantoea sp. GD03673]MDH2068326.1 restriction endonuclease subunit S [Pantoea sp. GD03673]